MASKCDSCVKNLQRYNGREVRCSHVGRRGQMVSCCNSYVAKPVKRANILDWTGVY